MKTLSDLQKIPGIRQAILKEAKAELARRIFWQFCLHYDAPFFNTRPFLEEIASAMQRIADRKIMRLSVSLPPRAGKSYLGSLFCAWVLGRKPSGAVMRNTCTATLYNKFSYDVRAIVLSPRYQAVFPITLADDKQNLQGWNTSVALQCSYFGAGVGGTIIGFGASELAMTDDLFRSFDDAMSERVLEGTHSWYRGNHISRMEKECPVIDIGTRWSLRDIIGTNMESGYYDESVVVRALTPEGESFCDAVKTTSEYLDIESRTPAEIWQAEYMQSPIEATGTLFLRGELRRFTLSHLLDRMAAGPNGKASVEPEGVLGYIDVADGGTDRLAFPVGIIIGRDVFITGVVFSPEKIDISLAECIAHIQKWNPDYVRVEANNQGGDMINQLRSHVSPERILKVTNTANKHSRVLAQYGFIKENFHFLCDEDIEKRGPYDLFFREVCAYTKAGTSARDDAPDALAGLAKFVKAVHGHLWSPR